MRYRIVYKSHRLSVIEYVVEADTSASAVFVAAALKATAWLIVREERIPA